MKALKSDYNPRTIRTVSVHVFLTARADASFLLQRVFWAFVVVSATLIVIIVCLQLSTPTYTGSKFFWVVGTLVRAIWSFIAVRILVRFATPAHTRCEFVLVFFALVHRHAHLITVVVSLLVVTSADPPFVFVLVIRAFVVKIFVTVPVMVAVI